MRKNTKPIILFFIKLCFSVALVFFALNNINSEELYNNFQKLDIVFLLIIPGIKKIKKILVANILSNIFDFFNIYYKSIPDILRTSFISSIYFLAVPGVGAPDIYLTYYFQKKNSLKKVVVSLFTNRIFGLIIFLMFTIFIFLFFKQRIVEALSFGTEGIVNAFFIGIGIIIISITIFLYFRRKLKTKINDLKFGFNIIKDKWKKNGIYFYSININGQTTDSKKMTIMK